MQQSRWTVCHAFRYGWRDKEGHLRAERYLEKRVEMMLVAFARVERTPKEVMRWR